MPRTHDDWERLVAAVLRKQQLWELFHAPSRSPSILSDALDSSSSSFLRSPIHDGAIDFSGEASSSTYWQQIEDAVSKLEIGLPKLVFVSDFSPAFDAKDVVLASAELLGRGTFGTAYTATMEIGVKIVVKRLKSVTTSEPEFKRQMAIVGNVKHENVAALRAYYSSEDERLMLHDHYSKGSVFVLLHGKKRTQVDWGTRLRIAIGAARGIAHIHDGAKLVHGNIKSSNVFLYPKQYGCVSDLGIANLAATEFMPTALCYAPEVKNTQSVTQASDVYSFGILLLELLTRKSPVHVPGGPEAVDLVKLVTSVKSKGKAAEVFDANLLRHPNIKNEMVKMLEIGMKCVAKSIKERPKMPEVVKMLEDLNLMNVGNNVSSRRKLVFVEDVNPTFDFDDIMTSIVEVIGRGIFGSSYKSSLDNGETILGKTFKEVDITFTEFLHHMEVLGRMRHTNIAKLKANCLSSDGLLLVYDYCNQDSMSVLLHGKAGTSKTPLDWESRLKIAVGAARGIAHIHLQDGGRFVHGNIKSSNVFLNREEYGLVSDVGIAKMMKPIRGSDRIPSYFAPEVKDTKNACQASDVYSFGVVLLELVSGRTSLTETDTGEFITLVKWIQSVAPDEWTDEVFDVELLRYQNEQVEEEMLQLLKVAMDCVSVIPERRPRMRQVVKMLEEISLREPSNESSLEHSGEQPSIQSRLEHLLEDLLPTLTP